MISVRRSFASRTNENATQSQAQLPKYAAISALAKYLFIPSLVASVGAIGYQMGCMDALADPAKKEKSILESICKSAGCSDPSASKTRMIRDGQLLHHSLALAHRDPQLHRVATVGRSIVRVARNLATNERRSELDAIRASLPTEVAADPHKVEQIANVNELFDNPIAAAANAMEGEWTYVLLDSAQPNAFVTALLPRKIFVTTAMMDQFIENDDEMALVLGHETSHLLLGHVKKRTIAEAALSTLEIMMLTTLGAFGGIGTLQAMMLLSTTKRWVSNAYSRESEGAADEMGIRLAAMGCYDTKKGIEVFRKMAQMDPPGMKLLTMELDHPSTEGRYEKLAEMSKDENVRKYEDTTCRDLRRHLANAMKDRHW